MFLNENLGVTAWLSHSCIGYISEYNYVVGYLFQLPLDGDVDLSAIADMTEGYSGADLQALLSDAQLAAVHEILDGKYTNDPGRKPVISDSLLKSTASRTRPSVSEAEKKKLYDIYSQFLDSKRSVAAQVCLIPQISYVLAPGSFVCLLNMYIIR